MATFTLRHLKSSH